MECDPQSDVAFGALQLPETLRNPGPPPVIPNYTLIRQIGYGSYGGVWLGKNSSGDLRAIKIVHQNSFKDAAPYERELYGIQRYQPISRAHPGLIHIDHFEEMAGYFFYAMELGDDQLTGQKISPETYTPKTLATELAARKRLSIDECLELGLSLATALREIHKRGLIHRDVKPSNIVFVEGVPKLADIGMVTGLNETFSYVGTEGFIPPEGPGTPQADIYSLGKVLYEACTGRDRQDFPHVPLSLVETSEIAQLRELNEVISKACETKPELRYKSAAEMHADLALIANGESIYKIRKLEQKIAALRRTGLFLGIAAGLAVVLVYPILHVRNERRMLGQRTIGFVTAQGNSKMESGDLLGALPDFAESLRLHAAEGHDQSSDRLRLGMVFDQCPKLINIWRAPSAINDGVFSPDGRRLFLGYESGEGSIYELDAPFASQLGSFRHNARIESVAYSHNGRYIASASDDSTVDIRDAGTLKVIGHLDFPDIVRSVVFCPNDSQVLAACFDGKARIYDWGSGKLESEFYHGSGLKIAQISHNGRWIATGGTDQNAVLWDANTGSRHCVLPHPSWVNWLNFSFDDAELVTACADCKARVFDIAEKRQRFPEMRQGDGVYTAEYSPDGRYILTAGLNGTAKFWLRKTLEPLAINPSLHLGERVIRATFASDARRVALFGSRNLVEIWDFGGISPPPAAHIEVASADGLRLLHVQDGSAIVKDSATEKNVGEPFQIDTNCAAELNRNGRFALIKENSSGTKLRIVDTSSGKDFASPVGYASPFERFSISDDGTYLAMYGSNIIKIIATASGHFLFSRQCSNVVGGAIFTAFSPKIILWHGGNIDVLNVTNGESSYPTIQFAEEIIHVALSADEKRLVAGCWDNQWTACYAQVWDLQTGRPVSRRLMQNDGVLWCEFSPDGKKVGTAAEDNEAIIWDTSETRVIPHLRHQDQATSIEFDAPGKLVVTASRDRTAQIWSVETGDPLSPPLSHFDSLRYATFISEDRVLTEGVRGEICVWPLYRDARPVKDIIHHANLLAGKLDVVNENGSGDATPIEAWGRLAQKYPSMFTVNMTSALNWHKFAAEQSQSNSDWTAAQFHLNRVADSKHLPLPLAIHNTRTNAESP